jgi:hypothetical protein
MARKRPKLNVEQILAWADEHHARTGQWPRQRSQSVGSARGESWQAIDMALRQASRGLPGDDSLARLLARERGATNWASRPRLVRRQILTWADAHRQQTGHWPSQRSGAITEAPAETWQGINLALSRGYRGLPGGDSLARLLARHRRQPYRRGRKARTG